MSGNKPVHVPERKRWSTAPDAELLDHVRSFGGLSPDLLSNPDFVSIYLAKIRADYRLYEAIARERLVVVEQDITVVLGDSDPILEEADIAEWSNCTTGECTIQRVKGGHFYFQNNEAQLAGFIKAAIEHATEPCASLN